jgi:hypothetical protein
MRLVVLCLAVFACLAVAGCGNYRWLRDDYMGKDLLEPELTPQAPARDSRGNPILPPSGR